MEHAGPLSLVWGALDPIAVPAMTGRLREMRPSTEVIMWEDVGHWPSVEVPERLADVIAERLR